MQYNFLVPQPRRVLYHEKKLTPKALPSQCTIFLPLAPPFFPKLLPLFLSKLANKPLGCVWIEGLGGERRGELTFLF